jgi:rhodanese-related sulfurtransferase
LANRILIIGGGTLGPKAASRTKRLDPDADMDELRDRKDALPRYRKIIIFCSTSVRAYEARKALEGLGFRDIKFLDGSVTAWSYPL